MKNLFCMEEIPRCNFFLILDTMRAMTRDCEKILGHPNLDIAIFTFCKGNVKLIFDKDRFKEVGEVILNKIINQHGWYEEINNNVVTKGKALLNFSNRLLKKDIKNLSDNELASLLKEFFRLKLEAHLYGMPGVTVDFEFNHFTNHLMRYLKERLEFMIEIYDINDVFRTLTTPNEKSLGQKEEEDLLNTAKEIKKRPDLVKFFQEHSIDEIEKRTADIDKRISDMLNKHYEAYCWLNFMYDGPAYKMDYFLERLKGIINMDIELEKINNQFREVKDKQEEYIRGLEIDEEHQRLFELAKASVFLKGYRKDCMFFGFYAVDSLMREIAKRLNIELEYAKCIAPEEVDDLIHGRLTQEELKRRYDCSAHVFERNKQSIVFDDKARRYIDAVAIKVKQVDELKGQLACGGKAKGRVKIINLKEDMAKMNQGDILVSIATQPDLVPAMEKAAAIVTDMGGITCHAAIVAREMNTPCIIGTKIATKVFKNGDLVEVDATNGIVRKL